MSSTKDISREDNRLSWRRWAPVLLDLENNMTQISSNFLGMAPVLENKRGFLPFRPGARLLAFGFLAFCALPLLGVPALAQTNVPAAAPSWLSQPMSLADAISIALLQNNAIRKGQSDLQAAYGVIIQTRAIALPKVRGTSGYTHDEAVERFPFAGPNVIKPPKEQWAGEIRIIQSIYEGGRIGSAWRSARLTKEQALLQYQAVVSDTLLDVRVAYYDVLQAEQQIVVQEASVRLLLDELEKTTRRFEAGTVPRFDVLRAEVEVANVRPKLIRAKNQYRIAKNNLATLLGYNIP